MKRRLVTENMENRISTAKIDALIEKYANELSKKDQETLAKPYVDMMCTVDMLNKTPHTIFNNDQWALFKFVLSGKVAEIMLVLDKLSEKNKKVDYVPLRNALEQLLTQ
jgi:hypothetical protein